MSRGSHPDCRAAVQETVDAAIGYAEQWLDVDDSGAAFDVLDLLTVAKVALQASEIPENGRTNSPIAGLLKVAAELLEEQHGRPGRDDDPLPDLEDAVQIVERTTREHPYMDGAAAEKLGQAVDLLRKAGEQLYQAGLLDDGRRWDKAAGAAS